MSATALRSALDRGDLKAAMAFVPVSTVPYLIADLAERSLRQELDTTPKPGLVDKQDNGAHKDMDYALMAASIYALRPYLTRIAVESAAEVNAAGIMSIGIEAEAAMLKATGGVNTHKGALFCIGLSIAAASFLACSTGTVEADSFRNLFHVPRPGYLQPRVRTGLKPREISRSVERWRMPERHILSFYRLVTILQVFGRRPVSLPQDIVVYNDRS